MTLNINTKRLVVTSEINSFRKTSLTDNGELYELVEKFKYLIPRSTNLRGMVIRKGNRMQNHL